MCQMLYNHFKINFMCINHLNYNNIFKNCQNVSLFHRLYNHLFLHYFLFKCLGNGWTRLFQYDFMIKYDSMFDNVIVCIYNNYEHMLK